MRPGVPWNVKGIEADAREAAQVAARRAGVSLGEYLTQLIMSEGRVVSLPQQGYQQNSGMTADGTWGPTTQYPPPPSNFRQPTAFQQPQPQNYPQAVPQFTHHQQPQHAPQSRDQLSNAAQALDSQIRGSEFTVVAHGLRELADRLESSERRAQQAISTINQSVNSMGDRIEAAERVKQLADVAFTSAADALAQAARDQAGAFDSLEATVRNLSNRIGDIERGASGLAGKETYSRLEQSFEQLKGQFRDAERKSGDAMAAFDHWQRQLGQRIDNTEHALTRIASPDAVARVENAVTTLKADFIESNGRAREEFSALTNFIRELGGRLEKAERALTTGSVGPRLDALDARHNALMDETRQALATMDTRVAQAAASGAPSSEIKVLKSSIDDLAQTVTALATRVDGFSDSKRGPMSGTLGAVQSTLEAITSKIEDGERRQAESVSTVSSALKSITGRLEEADKRQTQTAQTLNRRLDEAERRSADSAHAVEDALKALTQRVEASDRKHKEAVAGLRLTVDGLVAKAAADALPPHSPLGQATIAANALSSAPPFGASIQPPTPSAPPPPPSFTVPPAASVMPQTLSAMPPPPPQFAAEPPPSPSMTPPKFDEGMTVSALQTILAGTLSSQPSSDVPPSFAPEHFDPEQFASDGVQVSPPAETIVQPKRADDFLSQARRAAQAAAQTESEKSQTKRPSFSGSTDHVAVKPLNVGRLMIISLAAIALVAGILALVMTYPGGSSDDANRPAPGASIGEMLNSPAPTPTPAPEQPAPTPPTQSATPTQPSANFTPLPAPEGATPVAPSDVTAPPATTQAPPTFTAGASALPNGTPPADTAQQVATLEASANTGDAKAQFVLALRYAEGRGVPKDDAKAAALVTKAANSGLVVAQYRMGALYERGIGIEKNLQEARKWYERAAQSGNRKAMHNLAVLYADGTGIGQNYAEAARWFKQGAEYGVTDSQYNLAVLFERGMGLDKNPTEAAKWFALAAAQGDADAAARLEQLKKTMNPVELANALQGAKAYQAKPVDPVANEVPAVPG